MQRQRRPRRWVPALLIVLVVAIGAGWYLSTLRNNGAMAAGASAESVPVVLETYLRTVNAPGTLRAARRSTISAEVSGTVASIVRVGDEVEAGQVLLRFDTGPLARAVTQAEIALDQARTQLAIADGDHRDQRSQQEQELNSARLRVEEAEQRLRAAQDTLENSERLAAVGAESADALRRAREAADDAQREVDRARSALSTSQAGAGETASRQSQDRRNRELSVERAELDLRQAQDDLAAATIVAPYTGTVATVEVAEGDRVNAGTALLSILDSRVLELRGEVGESTVALVRPEQRAVVRAEAVTGVEAVGQVRSVTPEARVVQGVPVFDVLVELEAGAALRPGMTAEAVIEVEEVTGAVRLPLAALQAAGAGVVVDVQVGEERGLRPVTVIGQQGLEVVVRGDLPEGGVVWLPVTAPAQPSSFGPGGPGGGPGGPGF